MLNDFFYSHSILVVGLVVCFFTVVLPLLGLWPFHKIVDWNVREEDTSMVGLSYALCGGIFAVVLAFVAVGVYEAMDKTTETAAAEANSLSNLAFDTAGMPAEVGEKLRSDIYAYIDTVTQKEWPAQQAYQMQDKNFEEGWNQVRVINTDIAAWEPATPGQTAINADMVHLVNDLFAARRSRLLAAQAHLPNAVWQMLIFGLVLVAVFIYLYGPHSFKIHVAVTSFTMLSIGLVFTLIIALDYPFRGALSVGDEAFSGVKQVAHETFEQAEEHAPEHEPTAAQGEGKGEKPGQAEKKDGKDATKGNQPKEKGSPTERNEGQGEKK